jgi:hypothetical protein
MTRSRFFAQILVVAGAITLGACSAADGSNSSGNDQADEGGTGTGMDISWLYGKSTWIGGLDQLAAPMPYTDQNGKSVCIYKDNQFYQTSEWGGLHTNYWPEDINAHGYDRYTLAHLNDFDSVVIQVDAKFRPVFCLNGPGFQSCAMETPSTSADGSTQYSAWIAFNTIGDVSWKNAQLAVVTSEESFQNGPGGSATQLDSAVSPYRISVAYFQAANSEGTCPAH